MMTKTKPKIKQARSIGAKHKTVIKRSPQTNADTTPMTGKAASRFIDQRVRDLNDWRGEMLAQMRSLILEADPEMVEEVKWRGTPVWSHHGIICTGETYSKVVKLTFAQGAKLADPSGLFNASLDGNTRRAIDIPEGGKINAVAFKKLIKAAVALNMAGKKVR